MLDNDPNNGIVVITEVAPRAWALIWSTGPATGSGGVDGRRRKTHPDREDEGHSALQV